MKDSLLTLENVIMQFGGVIAVNDLSLEVCKGEIVALIGPNGAGKTTAFNVITGVYTPTSGTITFDGNVITNSNSKATKNTKKAVRNTPDKITACGIARTFQNIRLFNTMSVLENVLVAQHMHLKANFLSSALRLDHKKEHKMIEKAEYLLSIFNLESVINDRADSLPYGKQRHLEIARALATDPKLLMLDEPAAGMNPKETDEMNSLIVDIQKKFNLSVLLIEHHMDLVMGVSERIYVLDFGKLIASGTPSEIQNNKDVIEAYLGVADDD